MRKVPKTAALCTTTMDKTNRDKMFPQGKAAVGKGQNYSNAHGNSLGGDTDAQQNHIYRGRGKPTRGRRVQADFRF